MVVICRFEFTEEERLALSDNMGVKRPATRETFRVMVGVLVDCWLEDLCDDYQQKQERILEEEAAFLIISPEKFRQFAERGCRIAFGYDLTTRIAKFGGEGMIRYVYFFFLFSHILLAFIVAPLVLSAIYLAVTQKIEKHKKIVKFTFPVWLYVSISGVVVYLMISPYYSH